MQDNIRVSTITTLKASLEVTLSFVNYHLNSGIDHMYLFFDDPVDKSIAYLQDNNRITPIKCDTAHWKHLQTDPKSGTETKQKVNATLALDYARKENIDWLIHIDVDELLFGPGSLTNYLNKLHGDIDVVRFPVLEATPQKMHYENPFCDIRYFKLYNASSPEIKNFTARKTDIKKQTKIARNWHLKHRIAKLFGSASAWRKEFLIGHNSGKCAMRTSANIEAIKCHLPVPKSGSMPKITVSDVFYLLHYDCMGYDGWKQKWEKRISGENKHEQSKHSAERVKLASQIEEALHDTNNTKELYKKLYYLSNYDMSLLFTLGLLKKIDLTEELFDDLS